MVGPDFLRQSVTQSTGILVNSLYVSEPQYSGLENGIGTVSPPFLPPGLTLRIGK